MRRLMGLNIDALREHPQVRKFDRGDGRALYSAVDVVAALAESAHPAEMWEDLKKHEPALARWVETTDDDVEVLDLDGILRLVQAIPSPRAERLKWWMAESARRRVEEDENPELAILRTRKLYENRGYPRRWVEKRVRGVSSRHELTGEWYKRGVRESDDFRLLTNTLMQHAFGMDVAHYREFKGIARPGQTLRDSMSDMELTLTALAETTAAALSRARNSQGLEQLLQDARDAGEIAAQAAKELERRIGAGLNLKTRRPEDRADETSDAPAPQSSNETVEAA